MTRREDDSDRLCYDGALGWIDPDPEHFLASIGVECHQRGDCLVYEIGQGHDPLTFTLPIHVDWAVLRACFDDAETRARGATREERPDFEF